MLTKTPSRRPFRRSLQLAGTALLLVATAAVSACNLAINNLAEGRSEWKKDYSLAAGGSFEIRNTNGLIEIDPSDGDKVTVTAERIARAATEAEAKTAADAIEIKETVSGSSIILDAKITTSGINIGGGSRQVKFHVRAPKGTTLTLSNTNGNIDVRDMTGELRLSATNGQIRGRGIQGTTKVETTNGTIDLDVASLGDGGLTAETTNGTVDIALAKSAKARVDARVTNGAISTSNLSMDTSENSRRRLTGTLNGGGPEIRIETTNGAVTLRGK